MHQLRENLTQQVGLGAAQQSCRTNDFACFIKRDHIDRVVSVELVQLLAVLSLQLPTQRFDKYFVAVLPQAGHQ